MTSWGQGFLFGYLVGAFSASPTVATVIYFLWRDRRRAR